MLFRYKLDKSTCMNKKNVWHEYSSMQNYFHLDWIKLTIKTTNQNYIVPKWHSKLMHYSGYYSPSGLSTTSTLWLKQGIFVWQLGPAVVVGRGESSALISCISNYVCNITSLKQNFLPHLTCKWKISNTLASSQWEFGLPVE